MKACVITANIGNFDSPKSPISDMFSYTDSDFSRDLQPRLKSKYFKMCSHWLQPKYDLHIWVDSSFEVREGFIEWMIEQLGDADCAFVKHPWNTSIGEEVVNTHNSVVDGDEYAKSRYAGENMVDQVKSYLQDGFPMDFGLFCGGIFIRKNIPHVNHAFDHWYIENIKWSMQDQLSLPYILWKHNLSLKVIDSDLYGGPYHTWHDHN